MEERRTDNTEELAQSYPLSTRDKVLIISGIILALIIIAAVIIGIRLFTFGSRMKAAAEIMDSTIAAGSTKYEAVITSGDNRVTDVKGTLWHASGSLKASCDVDYGNRAVQVYADIIGNDAYFYIEAETGDPSNLHIDISALRYILALTDTQPDWTALLEDMSTDTVKLTDYYDVSKIGAAKESLMRDLKSPFALSRLLECTGSGSVYTIKTDMYRIMRFAANSLKPLYVNDKSYKNLIDAINDEKETLKAELITIRLTEADGVLDSIDITISGSDPHTISIAFSATGRTEAQTDFTANPDIADDVSISEAYRIIVRSGLDTDAALKEATMSLDAFAERFKYDIRTGTIVIVTDADGNDFRFLYDKYKLEEITPKDEEYNAWQQNGYVQLDTTNLDSGKYTVEIYEPGEVNNSSDYYNEAYLSALNAVYAITNARYEIPAGSVFLVRVEDTDFQFRYEDGNLYDIYEQYYYLIYKDYAQASLAGIDGVPSNVALFLPQQTNVTESTAAE